MSQSSQPEQPSLTAFSSEFNLGEEATKKGLEPTQTIAIPEKLLQDVSFRRLETDEEKGQRLWVEKSTLEHTRKAAEAKVNHERGMAVVENYFTKAVQTLGLIVLVTALTGAGWILLEEGTTEQKQRVSENIITLVLGGITGFSAGKVRQSPPHKEKP